MPNIGYNFITCKFFFYNSKKNIFFNIFHYIENFFYICTRPPWWRTKVLLKLSSKVKLRNFDTWNEDDGNSTTSLICTAILGSIHNLWCGLLFYPFQW